MCIQDLAKDGGCVPFNVTQPYMSKHTAMSWWEQFLDPEILSNQLAFSKIPFWLVLLTNTQLQYLNEWWGLTTFLPKEKNYAYWFQRDICVAFI